MNAETPVIIRIDGCLIGVQPDANRGREPVLTAMLREAALDGHRRLHGIDAPVECNEEPISGMAHLHAVMGGECRPEFPVVPCQQGLPGRVAHHPDQVGRGDDVGEHESLDHTGALGNGALHPGDDRVKSAQVDGCAELFEHGSGSAELPIRALAFVTGTEIGLAEKEASVCAPS